MTPYLDTKVGDLILAWPQAMRHLEALGIDYCCGGHRPLREACALAGRDAQAVLRDLVALVADRGGADSPQVWASASLTDLMVHIEATHHAYLKVELPRLATLLEKVLGAHGERHPELDEVFDLLQALTSDMLPHLQKEEQILFPFIRSQETGQPTEACFPSVQAPIRVMEAEHVVVGDLLARLRACTGGYATPTDGCASFRALYDGLRQLEADTHLHIYLENHLLHPRARSLEAALQV